ncbi:MAG: MipA/OmpV family protein [Thiolinea sp.]
MVYNQPQTKKRPGTRHAIIALAAIAQLWSTALLATEDTEESDAPAPWDVGLTLGVTQSPFLGGKTSLSISPTRLKHGGLRLNGFAWPVYHQPAFSFYLGAGLDEWNYERGDSDELSDMKELDRAINARVGIATELANGWATAEVAKDLAGAHEGMQAKFRYTTSLGSDSHEIRPYMEVQWLSEELTDYYVGVDSDEVATDRPQYQADAELALKAGVDYRHKLTDSFTLLGGLHMTRYGEEISDSPIIENEMIWGVNMGLTYRW